MVENVLLLTPAAILSSNDRSPSRRKIQGYNGWQTEWGQGLREERMINEFTAVTVAQCCDYVENYTLEDSTFGLGKWLGQVKRELIKLRI